MKFERLNDSQFEVKVPSSDPRKEAYVVLIDKDEEVADGVRLDCSCPGFSYRSKCRHQLIVRQELVKLSQDRRRNDEQTNG